MQKRSLWSRFWPSSPSSWCSPLPRFWDLRGVTADSVTATYGVDETR
jgi:hypothetical protein